MKFYILYITLSALTISSVKPQINPPTNIQCEAADNNIELSHPAQISSLDQNFMICQLIRSQLCNEENADSMSMMKKPFCAGRAAEIQISWRNSDAVIDIMSLSLERNHWGNSGNLIGS